jgi:hypothetical protein
MRFNLKLSKGDDVIYEGCHEAIDAESFGRSFAAVWAALHDRRMQQTTSVGELMSVINEDVLDDVSDCTVTIERLGDC